MRWSVGACVRRVCVSRRHKHRVLSLSLFCVCVCVCAHVRDAEGPDCLEPEVGESADRVSIGAVVFPAVRVAPLFSFNFRTHVRDSNVRRLGRRRVVINPIAVGCDVVQRGDQDLDQVVCARSVMTVVNEVGARWNGAGRLRDGLRGFKVAGFRERFALEEGVRG